MTERVSEEALKIAAGVMETLNSGLGKFTNPDQPHLVIISRELLALRAECDGLRKDAERYRWLRKRVVVRSIQAVSGITKPGLEIAMGMAFLDCDSTVRMADRVKRQSDELDITIDAALSRSAEAEPAGGSDGDNRG